VHAHLVDHVVEPPLRPGDAHHLGVLVHVRDVPARPEATCLGSVTHLPLRVCEVPVEQRPDRAQTPDMPRIEGQADPAGQLFHRCELRVEPRAVEEFQITVQSCVAREEGGLLLSRTGSDEQRLLCVREPVVYGIRSERRPVPSMERFDQCIWCAEPERHVERLLREPESSFVVWHRIEGRRQTGEDARPQRAVLVGERRQRLVEQRDPGRPLFEHRRDEESPEPEPDRLVAGDVAERRSCERFWPFESPSERGGFLEGALRRLCGSGPGEGVTQPKEDLASLLRRFAREQLEGVFEVSHGILVREQSGGTIAGPDRVVDRRSLIAERGRLHEVMRDRGEVGLQVGREYVLEDAPSHPMQLHPARRREVLVHRLAQQVVDERV
jgi:hypothetical protein